MHTIVEIEEGQKQGYFVVNLSKNQTFTEEPEFYFSNGFKPQQQDEEDVDQDFSDTDEESQHDDEEELPESSNARDQRKNQRKQGEMDDEEEHNAVFAELQNLQRFEDYDTETNADGAGKENHSNNNFIDSDDDTHTVKNQHDNENEDDEWGTRANATLERECEEIIAEYKKITSDDYDPRNDTSKESEADKEKNSHSRDVLWPFEVETVGDLPVSSSRVSLQPGNTRTKRDKGKARADQRMRDSQNNESDSSIEEIFTRKRSRTSSVQSIWTATADDETSFIDDSLIAGDSGSQFSSVAEKPGKNADCISSNKVPVQKRGRGRPKKNNMKRKPGRPKKYGSGTSDSIDQLNTLDNNFSELAVSRPYCRPSSSKPISNSKK
ncbi:hypothetical protein BD408DRAFT_437812 [Parasitella parasitica]|nr:hypothetical protein BD408DRAFT_437812 [Parasitella parasitica]